MTPLLPRRLASLGRRVSTLLAEAGVPATRAHGMYVPYRHAAAAVAQAEDEALPWLHARLDAALPAQRAALAQAAAYRGRFAELAELRLTEPHGARLDQDWFPGLDAAMAYTMVRTHRPRRIVEVGSGHSTRWLAQAIRDGDQVTHLCSVDPQPRRDIDTLCDAVVRAPLESVPATLFEQLSEGDMLFIDSSHVALPGTDVERLLTRIVPNLPVGVLVHIHDVFLPYGYPRRWAHRRYNEQQLVVALLAGGTRFSILTANHYLRRCHAPLVDPLGVSIAPGRFETSLWLQTT